MSQAYAKIISAIIFQTWYYKAPQLMALKFPNESRGISADCLLAEKGYDSDEMIEQPENQGMIAVMPPRKNRKVPCASSVGEA
jgi:hypothetical protein